MAMMKQNVALFVSWHRVAFIMRVATWKGAPDEGKGSSRVVVLLKIEVCNV